MNAIQAPFKLKLFQLFQFEWWLNRVDASLRFDWLLQVSLSDLCVRCSQGHCEAVQCRWTPVQRDFRRKRPIEHSVNDNITFLDIKVGIENGKMFAKWHIKKSNTVVYLHKIAFSPIQYETAAIRALV